MKKLSPLKFLGFTIVMMVASFGCSAPQSKDAQAPSSSDRNERTPTIEDPTPTSGCVPSEANNHCQPTTGLSAVQKCWTTFLDSAEAKKCAAEGKVWNRLQEKCTNMKLNSSNCTESAVISAFQAASFTDPAAILETVKKNIRNNSNSDVTLDQCGEVSVSGKTVLIPFFISKKYDGGDDGFGTYQTFAGKVCSKTAIEECTDPLLDFPAASTPTTKPCQ